MYWIDDWSLAANALAVTVVTYQTGNGKIMDADVLINAGFAVAQLPHAGCAASNRSAPRGRVPSL